MKYFIFLLMISFITFSSCSEKSTEPNDNIDDGSLLKITGSIYNKKQIEIPETAKIIVAWAVTWDDQYPDYSYYWTTADFDREKLTFELSFKDIPPDTCLNGYYSDMKLGVGFILLIDNLPEHEGVLNDIPESDVLGFVNDKNVIYLEGDWEKYIGHRIFNMEDGYNFGIGWDNPDPYQFDGWEKTSPNNIQLIIDDIENFTYPEWN